MQNKLGELSNQRYMDTISEQDRLMRERQAESESAAHRGRVENYLLGKEEAVFKGLLDASKDPGIPAKTQQAEVYRVKGDTKMAEQLDAEAEALTEKYVAAAVQAQTGEPFDVNAFRSLVKGGGLDRALKSMGEGGVNRRFAKELPIQEKQAATSAGNLALEKEKFGVEQGGGGKAGKQYIDLWSKPLNDAINFLEPVARGDNVFTMMYQQPAGYMSSKLSEIQMRLNNGEKLSKEDEKTITQSRDLKDMIKKYSGQRLPGQIQGPGSPADIALTKQTEAGLVRPTAQATPAAPMPAVDTTTPSPHTTGEKKTVVINGVTATYIWDGTKWLLSDSR
jgi:hypothetical protein